MAKDPETQQAPPAKGEVKAPAGKKKKIKRNIAKAIVHLKASFNNTIVTFTDIQGNVIAISTAGAHGFK
ncbi:MAG: 30S ribosomal protein S11, partial [Candidatus Sumerlaeia bacterium]|nr:30S ribosomal protein S11 [Candidatus Sumerlaeia bacterium]